jgi:hypothetical protein
MPERHLGGHREARRPGFARLCLSAETNPPLDTFFGEMRLLKAEGTIAMIRWEDADRPRETGRSMQFGERGR